MFSLIFLLPFSGLGISVFKFIVGPFSILFFYKVFTANLNSKFYYRTALAYSGLISIFFLSSAFRYNLGSYLPSLAVFAFASSVVLISPRRYCSSLFDKLENYVSWSFVALTCFCILEFSISINSRDIWDEFSKIIFQNGGVNSYFGIYRIRAGTMEPSILGLILVFYLSLFVFYLPRIYGKSYAVYSFITLTLVGFTMSTAAILGAVTLLGINFFHIIYTSRHQLLSFKLSKNLFQFESLIFLLILALLPVIGGPFAEKMLERVWAIFDVINTTGIGSIDTGNLTGSVGFRVGSLLVALNYLANADFANFLLGEGYSNFSAWLIKEYGDVENSGLSQGQPGNIITALVLGTGMIGTVAFLALLATILIYRFNVFSLVGSFYALFFMLSAGNLGSVVMWYLLFMLGGMNYYIAKSADEN